MKKFLAIALIAASFVACNEGEKKVEETTTTDTTTIVTPAVADTLQVVTDSTVKTTVTTDTTTIKK
ncbi:MAG TPA: hypothetical protein VLR49_01410 [Ferruginibacter sp.]|nr:hypothetical protein [Ferruginibacter sp.]